MHHSPVMGLHVTSISALPLTVAVDRTSRGPSPCQCQCPDGPLPTTAFSRGFLRLECKSKGMVMELEICCIAPSAHAASPFSRGAPIPPYPLWLSAICLSLSALAPCSWRSLSSDSTSTFLLFLCFPPLPWWLRSSSPKSSVAVVV